MNALFRSASYRRLWCNSALNAVSMGGDYVLIGWLVLDATQSSSWVGIAFALYYLPNIIFGIIGGGIADRFPRRGLLQSLDFGAAGLIILFSVLFVYQTPQAPLVLALTLVLGSLRAIKNPVRLALAYDFAGRQQATRALSGISVASRLGMLIGAIAIGLLTDRFGVAVALILMALMHTAAAGALTGIRSRNQRVAADNTPLWQNLSDYVREFRVNRVLLMLVLVTAGIELFGTSYTSALPELATSRLSLRADGLGLMHAAQASGGLLIGLLLFVVSPQKRRIRIYGICVLLLGISLITLGHVSDIPTVLLTLAVVSAMISAWDILTQSMMQSCVPDHLRGRSMGAWMFAIGSSPLGQLEMGFLVTAIGIGPALYLNGSGVLLVILLAFTATPVLRKL
ncbi:MAG TPA: MFS transporter [Gammaproteobacteria bacterium]|nr:MFS transporter [Gammaproteobacteria bacterium]